MTTPDRCARGSPRAKPEAARLDREVARLTRTEPTHTPEAVAAELEALLPDWRAALRQHAPEARQMLRKRLQGRVVTTPEVRHEQPGSRVRGAASVEPLLNVVLRPAGETEGGAQAMASPMPASWNQIAPWLREIDGLRRAA